jgi:hypothetical protein
MYQFEISVDKEGNKIISCPANDLNLKVIQLPEDEELGMDIRNPRMIFTANFHKRFEEGDYVCFEVLPPYHYKPKWSLELFYAAAEYYCQVELDKEPIHNELILEHAFYPYLSDDVTY